MPDHGAALLEQPGVNSAQAKTNPSQNKHGKRSHKKQQVRRATPLSWMRRAVLSWAHFSAIQGALYHETRVLACLTLSALPCGALPSTLTHSSRARDPSH